MYAYEFKKLPQSNAYILKLSKERLYKICKTKFFLKIFYEIWKGI